jgi:GT2 family glycosyltransferase
MLFAKKTILATRCRPSGPRSFVGAPPTGLRAGWHLVIVRASQTASQWIAVLRMRTSESDLTPVEFVLAQPFRWSPFGMKLGVFYIPRPQQSLDVDIHSKQTQTGQAPPAEAQVVFIRVFRVLASLLVCLQNMAGFVTAFKATAGAPRVRLRRAMASTSMNGQYMPKSYANWISWFDDWPEERIAALRRSPYSADRPIVSALVFQSGGPGAAEALSATMDSLETQLHPPCEIQVSRPNGEGIAYDRVQANYVVILQAGEVIPPHALLLLTDELVRLGFPDIIFADEDNIDAGGARSLPLFKPQPNLTLMCSGLLSRGAWLVRRDLLEQAETFCGGAAWAECVRLAAWFRSYQNGRAGGTRRIPYILTHRGPDTQNAPPAKLADVVESFLARAGFDAAVSATFPLRLHWRAGALRASKVSLVVPSRLRGETQISCLRQILAKTNHPNFEMLVVVTQPGELDDEQRAAIAQLRAHPNFRFEIIANEHFNYSAANNFGARQTTGDFLCLLNDDVAPMNGDWLDRMVGFFADSNCGIVGPKLFYPNLTTQHGGVIMGLAGLVEHANRFLPRGNPGYAWRAELDQELSAVTGACLLVRRDVFEKAGGLDEQFPTAFNDVDFCLRVGELGYGIVFAASVEMIHHETLTFGQHYSPEKADQEKSDIQRLRARWSKICRVDPFHNPNLSLVGRSEWNLAYPPRRADEQVA